METKVGLLQIVFAADPLVLQRAARTPARAATAAATPSAPVGCRSAANVLHRSAWPRGRRRARCRLRLRLRQHVGIVSAANRANGEQPARRLMPGDQKFDELVADVDVVELLSRRLVDAADHVRSAGRSCPRPSRRCLRRSRDDVVDHRVHESDVLARQGRRRLRMNRSSNGRPRRHHHRLQRTHHGRDKGW